MDGTRVYSPRVPPLPPAQLRALQKSKPVLFQLWLQSAPSSASLPASRDWLSLHATQKQAAASSFTKGGAAECALGGTALASKRRDLGKRKLAEDEARLERSARATDLQPATAVELEAVESSTGSLVFLWHFADGATSARPREMGKDARFDPWREAPAVGLSLLVVPPNARPPQGTPSSAPVNEPPSAMPAASGQLPLPTLASRIAATRVPLHREAPTAPATPATEAHSTPVAAAEAPLFVSWLLPSRLTGGAGRSETKSRGGESRPLLELCPNAENPEEGRAERSWQLVRALLTGERGAQMRLICANAKLVLRTLALLIELDDATATASSRDVSCSNRPAFDRWMDPVLLGWLLEPDASEEELMLPQLLDAHAPSRPDAFDVDACVELERIFRLSVALHGRLRAVLPAEALMRAQRRELHAAEILATMELAGLPIDPPVLTRHTEAISTRLRALTTASEALLHMPINLASAQQVSEALHCTLGLPRPTQTDAAARSTYGSTSEAHLQQLVQRVPSCPLPTIVLEHRELSKLCSTFLEPLAARAIADRQTPTQRSSHPSLAVHAPSTPSAGAAPRRVYTVWHSFATGTGRISSRLPNVQQVPKGSSTLYSRTDGAGASEASICVRDAFRAPTGCVLLSADYSQLEMRLMGAMSRDPKLQQMLVAGGDLFRRLGSAWHKKQVEDVTSTERAQIKQLCYGMIYGLGVERLADSLSLSVTHARALKAGFLQSFPQLARFVEHLKSHARKHGCVSTLGGRRRPLPHIHSSNQAERSKAERQAVNSVVQGSAADLMKAAMLQCVEGLSRRQISARLVAQLHDEVLFEVRDADDCVRQCVEVVRRTMEDIGNLDGFELPPMPVNVTVGQTWGSMSPA